jgi:hypothetical protein
MLHAVKVVRKSELFQGLEVLVENTQQQQQKKPSIYSINAVAKE